MSEKNPIISIVIPALNEEEHLTRLLKCLKKQTFTNFEIIVADADSEDATRSAAEKYGAIVVDGGLPGVGRNRGAERARGEYLLFLDADVQIGERFLEKGLQEIRERNIRIAGCEAVPDSDSLLDRVIHKTAFLMMKLTSETNPRLPGYCMFFKKDLFDKVGGFDEEVQLAEDYDLVRRAAEIAELELLDTIQVRVSMRRFDKEGRLPYMGKAVRVFFHRKLKGEIRDDSIEYEFDNFDPEEDSQFEKKLKRMDKQLRRIKRQLSNKTSSGRQKTEKLARKLESVGNRIERLLSGED